MSEPQQRYTTIAVTPELRDRLRARKRAGASYQDVIETMMEATADDDLLQATTD